MKMALLLLAAIATGPEIHFTDVTLAAGIKFIHHNGAAGKKYLPETMGSGVSFADLDGDGWPDILLLNCKDWVPKPGKRWLSALYRNNKNGTFTDVTAGSGLDVEMFAMGVAVADYDNDGRPDIYVTALGGDRLFHNEGNWKFRDVTAASGIKNTGFGTSAAWLDYDRDGKADLFVANYIQWSPKTDLWCSLDGATKSYCTPESSKGAAAKLFHNLGNGKFEDVSVKGGHCGPHQQERWASRCSITTTTGGPTSSSPTIRSRTSCSATTRTARLSRRAYRQAWRSEKTAWRAARWGSMRPITTIRGDSTCWSGTSRTR